MPDRRSRLLHTVRRRLGWPDKWSYGMSKEREKKHSAETIFKFICRTMSKLKRQQLGMLLARHDILPGWRVVRSHDLAVITPEGLSGEQARLYAFLEGSDGGERRENEVIRHLWPQDAANSPDVSRDKTLRNRLRKLQFDTNQNLRLFNQDCEIRRPRNRKLQLYSPEF
jgi:hypothetical protein